MWAEDACELKVPEGITQPTSSLLVGKFAVHHGGQAEPVWPCVTDMVSLLQSAANEPLKLRAPVSSFVPITRVHGLTNQTFPLVPPLEPSLSAFFGVRPAKHVGKRISPPAPGEQLTAKLQDKIHQCVSQVGAASKNIVLLALSIRRDPKHDMVGNAVDTITNMCTVLATCVARISAWSTVLQRQLWLKLSTSIPEDVKKELLEGPISSEGLFSAHYHSVFDQLSSSSGSSNRCTSTSFPTPTPPAGPLPYTRACPSA